MMMKTDEKVVMPTIRHIQHPLSSYTCGGGGRNGASGTSQNSHLAQARMRRRAEARSGGGSQRGHDQTSRGSHT